MGKRAQAAFVLLSIVLFAAPALASNDVAGADLVFVIDQSGSMMGRGSARGTVNDPGDKRIHSIQALEQKLIQSARAGMTNRVSVVEFGGRNAKQTSFLPQVTLSRVEIPALGPGDSVAVATQSLRDQLARVRPVFRGDTDIGAALGLARQEIAYFVKTPPQAKAAAKHGTRHRLVVLITDGQPAAENVTESTMNADIDASAGTIRKDATFVVFGFNAAEPYWKTKWGARWEQLATQDAKTHTGHAYLVDSQRDLLARLWKLAGDLVEPAGPTVEGPTYAAPGYLKALHVMIDFQQRSVSPSTITLRDPSGQPVPVRTVGTDHAEATISQPAAGVWRVEDKQNATTTLWSPEFEDATLVEPPGGVPTDVGTIVRYALTGRGPQGKFEVAPMLPPIRFEATVVSPSGKQRLVPFEPDPAGGTVASTEPVLFDENGTWLVQFTGKTRSVDGSIEHVVYQSADSRGDEVSVRADLVPIELALIDPPPGGRITLRGGRADVDVRFEVRDARDHTTRLAPAQFLADGVSLAVSRFGPDGASPDSVHMNVGDDALTARLPVDLGPRRWASLFRSRQMAFQLLYSPPNPWRDNVHYVGVAGGSTWLSPSVRVRESLLALVPSLFALAALVAIAAISWSFFGERWLIGRSDQRFQRDPRLVFKMSDDPLLTKSWSVKNQRRLVPGDTRVPLSAVDSWAIEKFRITRLRRPGRNVAVKVSYKPRPEKMKKVVVTLRARDDSGRDAARHSIQGFPDGTDAVFILLAGNN